MRINKYLADAGITSRRKADELVEAGRVAINGKTVKKVGTVINPETDEVAVDGKVIHHHEDRVVYILNKPKGVVTTANDPEGRKTVMEYIPAKPRVFPCGRLDYETMGLVVLTNDGNLCYQLTHPKFEHSKEYLVEGTSKSPVGSLKILESGKIVLKDGPVKVDDTALIKMSKNKILFSITVHEGRNRLVRRICSAAGIEVVNLTRRKLGHYELGDLTPGQYKLVS